MYNNNPIQEKNLRQSSIDCFVIPFSKHTQLFKISAGACYSNKRSPFGMAAELKLSTEKRKVNKSNLNPWC